MDILSYAIGKKAGSSSVFAFITATYDEGATCTCSKGSEVLKAPDKSGTAIFRVPSTGTWTVTAIDGAKEKSKDVVISTMGQGETVDVQFITIVPFATGTDEQIIAMIQAAHRGVINLHNDGGWNLGDKRLVHVGQYIDGLSISHLATDTYIAITSFDDYENCGCVMQVDFDIQPVATGMHRSKVAYKDTAMKNGTLPAMLEALPSYLKDNFIEFSCVTRAVGASLTDITTGNKLALRSEKELLNTTTKSVLPEGTFVPYFSSTEIRNKNGIKFENAVAYWLRSISNSSNYPFVTYYNGSSNDLATKWDVGLAPFGCL